MGASIQYRYFLEVLFMMAVAPMLLHSFINNVYQGILKQPLPIRFAPFCLVWLIVAFIYWFAFAPFKFFKDLNIPYVKPEPVLGNAREVAKLGPNNFVLKYMKQLGSVYGMFLGRRPRIVVSDLELLKQITVKDFKKFSDRAHQVLIPKKPMHLSLINAKDEAWKNIRKTVSPTFTAGKIKQTIPLIEECLINLLPVFENAAKAGESIEVFRSYGKFTVDGILSVAFGLQLDMQTEEERSIFDKRLDDWFRIPAIIKMAALLSPPQWLRSTFNHFVCAFDPKDPKYMEDLLKPVIAERRATGKSVRNDFLDLILSETPQGTTKLHDDEITASSITFLVAGYETTANTLAYTTYLLALNPEVQEKVYQEVKEKFNDDENLSAYDRVQNLEYLDCVVSESLRLYPPAYVITRESTEDCVIGENHISTTETDRDKGIKIPKGTIIHIPIWVIHHNPEFWENPEEFNPDRFSPDNRGSINPLSYLPFGYGPRNCIGMRFALVEAKLALASVIQKFKFERSPDTQVPLTFRYGITMSPEHGIYLRVVSRQ